MLSTKINIDIDRFIDNEKEEPPEKDVSILAGGKRKQGATALTVPQEEGASIISKGGAVLN